MQTTTRILLADDHALFREGVKALLTGDEFEIVAEAANGQDAIHAARRLRPDVAIVDIRLPPTHTDEGLRAALEIREKHAGVGVLVLSQYVEPGLAMKLLSASAEGAGYLLKDRVSDVDEFVAAVRRVGSGGSALDPTIVSTLLSKQREDDPLATLTPREREVLELMAEGRSNQAIADQLFVTLRAVEKHVTSIFSKLDLVNTPEDHRRVLAVLAYLRSERPDRLRVRWLHDREEQAGCRRVPDQHGADRADREALQRARRAISAARSGHQPGGRLSSGGRRRDDRADPLLSHRRLLPPAP